MKSESPLQLSQILIYPIKSLGGVPLSDTRILPKGLPLDRRWMLIDEQRIAMTQRVYPMMALFRQTIEGEQLKVSYKDNAISIRVKEYSKEPLEVTIWNDTVIAYEVSKPHSQWFSEMLRTKCTLVHFPDENPRPVDSQYKINDDHVSLADGFPFLIIGQSSLDDLNSRLSEPVPMNRFRPNFVFTGGKPYLEDTWKKFIIGNNLFAAVKPCGRCTIPTVNQLTGEKSTEPLKTLSTYRKKDNIVYFGQNVIALQYNIVSVGDVLQAVDDN